MSGFSLSAKARALDLPLECRHLGDLPSLYVPPTFPPTSKSSNAPEINIWINRIRRGNPPFFCYWRKYRLSGNVGNEIKGAKNDGIASLKVKCDAGTRIDSGTYHLQKNGLEISASCLFFVPFIIFLARHLAIGREPYSNKGINFY